ncbi:MAG: HEPN domain-containing protein [Nanoarchaeota archaeon]|nr:HEPN domain-containing protein [Nanoarchaeota archaeon]
MAFRDKHEYLGNERILESEIAKHKAKESIQKAAASKAEALLNFSRARSELKQARILFEASYKEKLKQELNLLPDDTFYSGAIAHAYYAIFFSAKALLLTAGIRTKSPNIHKATLDAFAYYFIINGKLDVKLLRLYESALVRADSLLGLFAREQDKRGKFTYRQLPQTNKEPAEESIEHAKSFLMHIEKLIAE